VLDTKQTYKVTTNHLKLRQHKRMLGGHADVFPV